MRVKVQVIENGIARDIIYDSARDMICVRDIFPGELEALAKAAFAGKPTIFAPEHLVRTGNRAIFDKFAKEWPLQFYSGSHKAPTGLLLGPDGALIEKKAP